MREEIPCVPLPSAVCLRLRPPWLLSVHAVGYITHQSSASGRDTIWLTRGKHYAALRWDVYFSASSIHVSFFLLISLLFWSQMHLRQAGPFLEQQSCSLFVPLANLIMVH